MMTDGKYSILVESLMYHIPESGVWSLESGHVVTGSKFKLIGYM